jgi:hypothetical protein
MPTSNTTTLTHIISEPIIELSFEILGAARVFSHCHI